ncbi:helix-turn-helix domain-containing protein [Ruegeria aquimaris]|uniref:AraC family transcriptional regulator n=1 Tax=Ruegeria aquimaris TaxID=2984333 RepID=A0ABT3AN50_9RHOB|nr:AraC family transcriptional regulator [Ruegeria sp. XHP0148]MCV2889531.1 AraC family transcriptional regulator [Ruegeria sp. XHP0148]
MAPSVNAPDIATFEVALTMAMLVLSLFCTHALCLSRKGLAVRWPLVAFFVLNAISLLRYMLRGLDPGMEWPRLLLLMELGNIPVNLAQPPLIWFYVCLLTGAGRPTLRRRQLWHLLPAALAVGFAGFSFCQPQSTFDNLILPFAEMSWVERGLVLGFYLATALFHLMGPVFSVMVIRRLMHYRIALKDLFASTERREMRWLRWLALMSLGFWCVNIVEVLLEVLEIGFHPVNPWLELAVLAAAQFLLIWVLGLWGLRQKPGLMPPPRLLPPMSVFTPEPMPPAPRKYGNSALSDGRMDRLSDKIRLLMKVEHLYRDPDLTLWDLATRLGASTNHVSQALNDRVGQCFFDYVNEWRVRDAAIRLCGSETAVLDVAFAVGFNSKSAFYKSFRRVFEMTPIQYRQRHRPA